MTWLWLAAGFLVLAGVAVALLGRRLLPQPPVIEGERPVVFFDGVCGLCNSAIDFIMRHDPAQLFLFAPLQGDTARDRLGIAPGADLDTMILVTGDGRRHDKSDAALRIAMAMGGGWKLLGLFLILPRFLRNAVYGFVARNRYRWFGRKESCRLPTPAERKRFLA